MSDNKYTERERRFIRLHNLQHDFARVELAVIEYAGERCPDYEATCVVCKTWKALDVLKEAVLGTASWVFDGYYNEAQDFIINPKLAQDICEDNDDE